MSTNFENLGSWQQDKGDKFDWTLQSGSTSSLATGPSGGQGGSGKYQKRNEFVANPKHLYISMDLFD